MMLLQTEIRYSVKRCVEMAFAGQAIPNWDRLPWEWKTCEQMTKEMREGTVVDRDWVEVN